MKKKSFGEFIREKRYEKGISLRELARISGLSPTFLSQTERNNFNPPSEEKIVAIANALGIEQERLVIMAGKVPKRIKDLILSDYEVIKLIDYLIAKKN